MPKFHRISAFMPDGTVLLDDGREMQGVVSATTGAMGVRPKTDGDRISSIDQYVPLPGDPTHDQAGPPPIPSLAELGLDQT